MISSGDTPEHVELLEKDGDFFSSFKGWLPVGSTPPRHVVSLWYKRDGQSGWKAVGPIRSDREYVILPAGTVASGQPVSEQVVAAFLDDFRCVRVTSGGGSDNVLLAYGVPGLILLVAVWKLPGLSRRVRMGCAAVGGFLGLLYLGLEIRRFWQGDWLGASGVVQGELYTYTLALMLIGAGLLYQAIARRSVLLRRIGMAVIAVTIAKVFLIDASGLTGLTRVVSFLGLGLSLAGLAWLNRWAGQASEK